MKLRADHDTPRVGDAVPVKASNIFVVDDIEVFQRMRKLTRADCFGKHVTLADRECILLVLSECVCGRQGKAESCQHSMRISMCTDCMSLGWAPWEVCCHCCKCFNIVSNISLLVPQRMTPCISMSTMPVAISVQVFFVAVLTINVGHGWNQRFM